MVLLSLGFFGTENLTRPGEQATPHRDTVSAKKHLPPSFKPPHRSVVAGTDWGAATRLVSTTAAVPRRYLPRSRQPSFDRPTRQTLCPGKLPYREVFTVA